MFRATFRSFPRVRPSSYRVGAFTAGSLGYLLYSLPVVALDSPEKHSPRAEMIQLIDDHRHKLDVSSMISQRINQYESIISVDTDQTGIVACHAVGVPRSVPALSLQKACSRLQ
jgi:hypothetical protein